MKITFGAIITDGYGSVGGQTISKNHFGRFMRTKVTPTNPQTAVQQAIRASQGAISTAWKSLTVNQRKLWEDETVNYPRTDSSGNVYFLDGFDLFMSLNLYRNIIGLARIDDPGIKVVPTGSSGISIDCIGPNVSFRVTYTVPLTSALETWALYATDQLSPGINYVSTKLRFIKFVTPALQASDDIITEFNALGFNVRTDKKYFAKLLPINILSGCPGIEFRASAIAT